MIGVGQPVEESYSEIKSHLKSEKLTYDFALDGLGSVGKAYGVNQAPQFVVLDKSRTIRYIGAYDDSVMTESRVKKPYVRDVVEAVLQGKNPAVEETRPQGTGVRYVLPVFPWPVPKFSSFVDISRGMLAAPKRPLGSLGDVADVLSQAFENAGYIERSYYGVPGGFAIVTRLERMQKDGSPDSQDRWPEGYELPKASWTVSDVIKRIFTAREGRYRIIVFVVTDRSFGGEASPKIDPTVLASWASNGAGKLPEKVRQIKYDPEYGCRALVYEFEKLEGREPRLILPSEYDGRTHLLKAHLWSGLGGP